MATAATPSSHLSVRRRRRSLRILRHPAGQEFLFDCRLDASMTFIVQGISKTPDLKKEVEHLGRFEDLKEAVATAESWVDALLMRDFQPGMKPEELWECFKKAQELPYIFRDDADTFNVYVFDPVKYAKRRCEELCSGTRDGI